jgi:hypothetical protein
MAQKRSPFQPGRSEPSKSENWGRPSGGTDFLIARTGGDFNVPIRKAAWRHRQIPLWRLLTERQQTQNTKPLLRNTDANGKSFKEIENNFQTRESAWQIPGNGEHLKRHARRFTKTNVKNKNIFA